MKERNDKVCHYCGDINKCATTNRSLVSFAVVMDEPRFAQPIPNVTVAVGRDANLPCVVEHLGTYKVRIRRNNASPRLPTVPYIVADRCSPWLIVSVHSSTLRTFSRFISYFMGTINEILPESHVDVSIMVMLYYLIIMLPNIT